MTKLTIDGTVRSITTTERRKKDTDLDAGKIVIMNTDGYKVIIEGPTSITEGFNPEEPMKITIERTQRTLNE